MIAYAELKFASLAMWSETLSSRRHWLKAVLPCFCLLSSLLFSSCDRKRSYLVVTTWNLNWFPGGKSDDASEILRTQRIKEAAVTLSSAHPDIVLLQEIRDYQTAALLGEAMKPEVFRVAVCSAFKEPFQHGIGRQQVAILSRFDAQAAWSEGWSSAGGADPPRGFAFSWFKVSGTDLGVYCLHLKSNLITRGDRAATTARNILKREVAVRQILGHVEAVVRVKIPAVKAVIIGGDFNTNQDQELFAEEQTITLLERAGFRSGFERLELPNRITHPAAHGYPAATFDYIFGHSLVGGSPVVANSAVSDHLPVTRRFMLPLPRKVLSRN